MADMVDWRRPVLLTRAGSRYMTPAKLTNLARSELEQLRREALPRSRPYVVFFDVTNSCNLRCPYCPTGARRESGRARNLIELSKVRQLLDEVGKYLISANLFNWGEPLLHPQLAEIAELCHDRGVFTQLSTNLSIKNWERLTGLVGSGLDYMVVSISGVSQKTYNGYHRNGEVDLVFENLRRIVALKRMKRRSKPYVEVKYLCFKHNLHEVEAARDLAGKIGVDLFRHVIAGGAEEAILDRGQAPPRKLNSRHCHQLWNTIALEPDAGLAPCCYLYFKEDDFGEYSQQSIQEIWHNKKYELARKLFDASAVTELPPDLRHPCLKCSLVHKQAHLVDYLKSNPNGRQGHRTGGV